MVGIYVLHSEDKDWIKYLKAGGPVNKFEYIELLSIPRESEIVELEPGSLYKVEAIIYSSRIYMIVHMI